MNLMEALDCLDSAVHRINRLMEFIGDYDEAVLTKEEMLAIKDTVTSMQCGVDNMATELENTLREGDAQH